MKSKLSFSNPSLQEINLEAETVIQSHLNNLDRISNDIKALEDQLKMAGIPFTFTYIVSSTQRIYEENKYCNTTNPYEEDRSFLATFIEQTDVCLVWGKTEDGTCRLSHNAYTTILEVAETIAADQDFEVFSQGKPTLSFYKPLIETKSHFRVKVENELPFFYKKLIVALKERRDQENIFEYSPHYNYPLSHAKIIPEGFQFPEFVEDCPPPF